MVLDFKGAQVYLKLLQQLRVYLLNNFSDLKLIMAGSQPNEKEHLDKPFFYSQGLDVDALPYSQDLDAYLKYQDTYSSILLPTAIAGEQETNQTDRKKTQKRKKSSELTSHIIKKVRKGRRIIKISISNLEDSADNDEVMVQYIVNEQYDEILDSAENIVERIARKISRSDEL
ncbi:hypothetical protein NE865_03431 [Phthorimaea operculella]|nr:hypothetical protein NE865_03431 [Phthorimaea operculella]